MHNKDRTGNAPTGARKAFAIAFLVTTLLNAEAAAQTVASQDQCRQFSDLTRLRASAERMLLDLSHYERMPGYKRALNDTRAATRRTGPPPGLTADQVEDIFATHIEIVNTTEKLGQNAGRAIRDSNRWAEQGRILRLAASRAGCVNRAPTEVLTDSLTGGNRLAGPTGLQRIEPILLWLLCFSLIFWGRKRQMKDQNGHHEKRLDPRYECSIPVTFKANGKTWSARVIDVSLSGCKLACSRPLGGVLLVQVDLDLPQGPRDAKVRWTNANHAGLMFCPALKPQEMAEFLKRDETPGALPMKDRRPLSPGGGGLLAMP